MKQCFVISPIGPEGSEIRRIADDVFDYIIGPAAEECGIKAFRSDHMDKPGRISDQMFQAIFNADVCIAVLTNHNPNVFYELAIAQTAQRPVIVLIEKGQELPFDISDLRCVPYDLDIRSYQQRTHIRRIVSHLNEFASLEWKGVDLFGAYRPKHAAPVGDIEFFDTPGDFRAKYNWLSLLQETVEVFEVMGVSLMGWRKTRNFRETLLQKASDGCKARILLMDLQNPILSDVTANMAIQEANITQNFDFFRSIADEHENVQVRQMKRGIPHCYLTRCDQYAVTIQYLSSQKWGTGPLWRCTRSSQVYSVLAREFEAIWKLNEPAAAVRVPARVGRCCQQGIEDNQRFGDLARQPAIRGPMRTFTLLVGIAAIALCQPTTRTLQFTQLQTPPQLTEAATVIRSIGEIRDLRVDVTSRTITMSGDTGQLALADWLLPRLDRLPDTAATGAAEPDYRAPEGDDVTRVFYFTHPATSGNMQQMAVITRSVTEIRRAFVSNAAEAFVVRGTNEQLDVARWILGTLDRPSLASDQRREHRIRDEVGEDTIRVFFLPKFDSPEELQNFASELRMATQIRRVFTYYPLRAILMRSTPGQIAHAARLVNQP